MNRLKHEKTIQKNLSYYLSIINTISKEDNTFAIFGGAIRDIIAGQEINDIDILCLPNAFKSLRRVLLDNNFKESIDTSDDELYKYLKVIHSPINFQKDNYLKIQLIRPNLFAFTNKALNELNFIESEKLFYKVLASVDLTCCGVFYKDNRLYESVNAAIDDCEKLQFTNRTKAIMLNPNRLGNRIKKLEDRGWFKY